MSSLEELGKKAYQKHILGDFKGALSIYEIAIKKYPKDARLLNNRCCCYIEIKDYKKAMEDADRMVAIFPDNPKSYYRKGEILTAMKRYIEAEESFRHVLTLNPSCEDAKEQLLQTQVKQLCLLGYNKQQALKALRLTLNENSSIANVEDAENILKFGNISAPSFDSDSDIDGIYYSDDDDSCISVIKQDQSVYDPLLDPSNPVKSNSLWVGNVTEAVTEKMLTEMFSKFGKILSVFVYHSNFCAFINYHDTVAPGKAMKALQGKAVGGKNILIKFPNSVATQNSKRSKAI